MKDLIVFNKHCEICGELFKTKQAGSMWLPISDGHEECKIALDFRDKQREEERKRKEDEQKRQTEINEGFFDCPIDWTGRGWDRWVENSENKAVVKLLRGWTDEDKGIAIGGSAGIGKTHMLAATAIALYDQRRQDFRFIKFSRWADRIRSVPMDQSVGLISELERASLLFIDDLTSSSMTDHVEDKLYQILDYRFELKKSTFISTNLTLNSANKLLSSRVISRLLGLCRWVDIVSIKQDWRQK